MRTRFVRAAAAILGVLSIASCDSITGPGAELAAARSRWEAKGLSSYRMTIFRSCECTQEMTGPVEVTVENGVITSRIYTRNHQPVPSTYFSTFTDVEGLFDNIEKLRAENPYKWSAEFHPDLGYPMSYGADMNKQYVDDEFSVSIFNLESSR